MTSRAQSADASPLTKGALPSSPTENKRFVTVFLSVAPAMFLGSLDQTIVATALPAIATSLHGFTQIAWIVTAYLLAATVAAPIYGRIGDAVGRKPALLGALALFVAGSLGCGLAPDLTTLEVARAIQGLGGGGLMTLSQSLIGEAVNPKDRGRFQGWFGAVFALASTLGPIAGGLLSEHVGWRWIFWINIPLGLGAAVAAWPLAAEKGQGPFTLDVPGTSVFVGATLALLLVLTQGPGWGWTSTTVLALGGAGILGFALLLPIERRVAAPLISPALLQNAIVWRVTLCTTLFAAVLFAAVIQVPLLLELVLGLSPSISGLLLIPLTLAQVVISTWTGLRISNTGLPRGPLVCGLGLAAAGFALLAAAIDEGAWMIAGASTLFGLGLGTTMPAAQTMVQWAGGKAHLGTATATLSFARSIGGVMGTAATSAILLLAMEWQAPGAVAQVQAALDVPTSGIAAAAFPLNAIREAFRWVFGAMAMIALAAALLAISIRAINLGDPEPAEEA
ncbi:MFS transporter [Nguyenibacter vanlangensis]|uniref:MFS transporter n=1 Tax=Nguyenibacter vanlangensis TaxID=1216886 RepID=A0ABZ3D9J4_9PROT